MMWFILYTYAQARQAGNQLTNKPNRTNPIQTKPNQTKPTDSASQPASE